MKSRKFSRTKRARLHRYLITTLLIVGVIALTALYIEHDSAYPTVALGDDGDTDDNGGNQQEYAAAVALAAAAPKIKYDVSSSTPQFVLLSFDGSKSLPMLAETTAFEHQLQAEGEPLHFTYFINASYFLTKDTAHLYQAPGQAPGISKLTFSTTTADIAARVQAFNSAYAEGNEIGSHTVGHFDGGHWSTADWTQEFNSFTTLMQNVAQNNPSQPIDAPTFLSSIRGFRAPFLATDDALYQTLGNFHFTYDTSGIGRMDTWPTKDAYGIWHIPLGTIYLGPAKSPVVAMDYNIWQKQSNVKELAVKGTPLWNTYFDQTENAYMQYFDTNYNGNRAPIVIANHFGKWNDGVYWEAMKAFAQHVCGRPQVHCVTYKEFVEYLNTTGVPQIVR